MDQNTPQTTPGTSRVIVLATPTPTAPQSQLDWNYINKMFTGVGGQVHEQCSGAALGSAHGEFIIQATLKDYSKVPQLINELRRVGLNASVYPWQSASEYVQSFTQSFAGSDQKLAGSTSR